MPRQSFSKRRVSRRSSKRPVRQNRTSRKSRKSKVIIPIAKEGSLDKFGYYDLKQKNATQRRIALKRALKNVKPLSVYRRIIALATLHKNTDPKLHVSLLADADWIKEQLEYIQDREKTLRKSKRLSRRK